MTGFDRPVQRVTVGQYRVTITGVIQGPSGSKLIARLESDQQGDYLVLREAGRRLRVRLSIPELYRKGLIAMAAVEATERARRRRRRG